MSINCCSTRKVTTNTCNGCYGSNFFNRVSFNSNVPCFTNGNIICNESLGIYIKQLSINCSTHARSFSYGNTTSQAKHRSSTLSINIYCTINIVVTYINMCLRIVINNIYSSRTSTCCSISSNCSTYCYDFSSGIIFIRIISRTIIDVFCFDIHAISFNKFCLSGVTFKIRFY